MRTQFASTSELRSGFTLFGEGFGEGTIQSKDAFKVPQTGQDFGAQRLVKAKRVKVLRPQALFKPNGSSF